MERIINYILITTILIQGYCYPMRKSKKRVYPRCAIEKHHQKRLPVKKFNEEIFIKINRSEKRIISCIEKPYKRIPKLTDIPPEVLAEIYLFLLHKPNDVENFSHVSRESYLGYIYFLKFRCIKRRYTCLQENWYHTEPEYDCFDCFAETLTCTPTEKERAIIEKINEIKRIHDDASCKFTQSLEKGPKKMILELKIADRKFAFINTAIKGAKSITKATAKKIKYLKTTRKKIRRQKAFGWACCTIISAATPCICGITTLICMFTNVSL